MSTSAKVGELFKAAGEALTQLGELTMQLHPTSEPTPVNAKWTEVEIDMMLNSVKRFCADLNAVSEIIKTKTIAQIRTQMKRKAYEEAGLSLPASTNGRQVSILSQAPRTAVRLSHASNISTNEVTLSALNCPEDQEDQDQEDNKFDVLTSLDGSSLIVKRIKLEDPSEDINVV